MASSDLYTKHADVIEAALSYACRLHRLTTDACEEFASWARLKIIDNDYAVLRKFEGRSSMRTFLITVAQRLYLDWRNAEWGKWRPTTDARRLGTLGIELERLIIRDRSSFGEAADLLVARGLAESREACAEAWAKLPQRPQRSFDSESVLETLTGHDEADALVADRERAARARAASAALAQALSSLSPADQVIFRLRYHDGFTVARIAKLSGEEPKALYRRFDRLAAEMKAAMLQTGVPLDDIAELLANPKGDLQPVFDGVAGDPKNRPSTRTSAGGEHG